MASLLRRGALLAAIFVFAGLRFATSFFAGAFLTDFFAAFLAGLAEALLFFAFTEAFARMGFAAVFFVREAAFLLFLFLVFLAMTCSFKCESGERPVCATA